MFRYLIKEISIILCTLYIYMRILNLKPTISKKKYTFIIIFSLILVIISVAISIKYDSSLIPLQIIFSCLPLYYIFETSHELTFASSTISFFISYLLYTFSAILISLALSIFSIKIPNDISIFQLLVSCLQILFVILLFKFKRLKNGIPFISNKNCISNLYYISLLSLFLYSICSDSEKSRMIVLPITLFIFLGFLFYLDWQRQISNDYRIKIHLRLVNMLDQELLQKDSEIKALDAQLELMSKIIHKNNKMIPAMLDSVCQYLQYPYNNSNSQKHHELGNRLISSLNQIQDENLLELQLYENSNNNRISSGNLRIDMVLNYMQQKALDHEICLNVFNLELIPELINSQISEADLCTLLADLLENAIIATLYSNIKLIRVIFRKEFEIYYIDISDSGVPFEKKVIQHFGKNRITTHRDSGGSGIGLITICNILSHSNASLRLSESNEKYPFTKTIYISFDNKNRIFSNQNECVKKSL